jgi:hypothetical protein
LTSSTESHTCWVHPGDRLVAGDAGVVHQDVQVPVPAADVAGQPGRRVRCGEVELVRRTADVVGDRGERVAGGGHVERHDVRAVAGQYPRDGRADAPGRAGDQGDLAVERAVPVGRRDG